MSNGSTNGASSGSAGHGLGMPRRNPPLRPIQTPCPAGSSNPFRFLRRRTLELLNVVIWVAAALAVSATPTRAQIASYVDGHGNLVYTNEDSTSERGAEGSAAHLASRADSRPAPPAKLAHIVDEAAEKHDLDPALVDAVISTESGWNPQAVSDRGAMGLMQLIPGTAERFGVENPFDPAQNIDGGTAYLKTLLDRYNGDLTKSLAAYNAGERAVDRSGGVPPFWETQRYVRKVKDAYFRPGSGRNPASVWSPPRHPIRKSVNAEGQVVYTNE
jgi:soluble lytic murein transglycosylase-like protein